MKPNILNRFLIKQLLAAACITSAACAATATKSGSGTDLALGESWTGGSGPGFPTSADVATWDTSSLGAGLTTDSDVNWGSIAITGALENIDIVGFGIITTGNITLAGSQTLSIANLIELSGNSIYNIADVTGSTATDATFSGGIFGDFVITKSGDGTLTLPVANSYTGGTSVTGGVLSVTNSGGLGTNAVTLDSGTLRTNVAVTNALSVASGKAGTLEVNAAAVGTGTATINGTLTISGPSAFTSVTLSTASAGTGTIQVGNTQGGNTVTSTNRGRLRANSNVFTDFTGDIRVLGTNGGGNLCFFDGISTTTQKLTIDAGGYVSLNSQTGTPYVTTFGGLNGGGSVTTNAPGVAALTTLSIGNGGADGDFSGVISQSLAGASSVTVSVVKNGAGTQILSGDSTYTGATSVNGGTLAVNGSLANSDLTVNTNCTLAGTGTVKSAAVSGTVSPGGSAIGTLTVNNALTLNSGSTTVCQINRTATQTADQLFVISVSYGGMLSVENTGAPLEPGDTFQLFNAVPGSYTGNFSTYNLPTLSAGYNWDTSGLGFDGTIKVVNNAPTPVFTPVAGGYGGAQTITMNSGAGTTIYYTYTTNGTEPGNPSISSNSGTPGSGTAAFNMPTDSSLWIKAIATKVGSSNSPVASATYVTVTTPTWTQPLGGDWTLAENWQAGVSPNGADVVANFNTLDLTGDTTVNLDQPRTIGSMIFGDTNPSHNWILTAATATPLTLDVNSGTPSIAINNQTTTISAVLAGTKGLAKSGAGTLVLTAANTYTGGTNINGGTLALGASATLAGATGTIAVGAGNSGILDLLGVGAQTVTSGIITIPGGSQLTIARSGFVAATQTATSFTGTLAGAGTLVIGSNPGSASSTGRRTRFDAGKAVGTGTAFDNFSGAINVQSGANLSLFNGTLTSANSNNLTIGTSAFVGLLGGTTTFVGALNGDGSITKNNGSTTATLSVASGNFSGVITFNLLGGTGTVAMVKTGNGTLTLSGNNGYNGGTTINGGTLLANNAPATSATGTGSVTVKDTATLGGTGRVSGAVILESGGTLAPGASIGALATGALTLPAGASLAAQINSSGSPTADVVNVTGALILGGALTVTDIAGVPAAIPLTTKLTLITYNSGLTGTFTGKAEGSTFAVGGNTFKIRYADAGKVTLEAVSSGTGYSTWATTNAPSQTASQDYDNDGVPNGVEWVLGGLATTNDAAKRPTVSTTGGNLIFSFVRNQASLIAGTAVSIQVGSDLATWPSTYIVGADTASSSPEVTVTSNGNGTDTVKLTVPQAANAKKFARLSVVITP